MGHSDKPLFIVGSALVALLLITGFNTYMGIKDKHHQGQPEDGYTLEKKSTATAAAPVKADAQAEAAPAAADPAVAVPAAATSAAAPTATTDTTPAAPSDAPSAAVPTPATSPAAAAGAGDIVALVASGDAAKGKKRFGRCKACHSYKKDDPSKTGPNLYGLVGRDVASQSDYADKYSAAMKAKGGKWTLEELSAFITKPKKALPGTAMIFPGLKKEKQRVNLLAYIKTLSD